MIYSKYGEGDMLCKKAGWKEIQKKAAVEFLRKRDMDLKNVSKIISD